MTTHLDEKTVERGDSNDEKTRESMLDGGDVLDDHGELPDPDAHLSAEERAAIVSLFSSLLFVPKLTGLI